MTVLLDGFDVLGTLYPEALVSAPREFTSSGKVRTESRVMARAR